MKAQYIQICVLVIPFWKLDANYQTKSVKKLRVVVQKLIGTLKIIQKIHT